MKTKLVTIYVHNEIRELLQPLSFNRHTHNEESSRYVLRWATTFTQSSSTKTVIICTRTCSGNFFIRSWRIRRRNLWHLNVGRKKRSLWKNTKVLFFNAVSCRCAMYITKWETLQSTHLGILLICVSYNCGLISTINCVDCNVNCP